ncbi:MAG: UDP-N-acetylmuramate dehydrogenase [Cytophagales bacterium]
MQVIKSACLKKHNTFGINANADFLVSIEEETDLEDFFSQNMWSGRPILILGGGSNLLFTQDFEGVVLKVNILGKSFEETENDVICTVNAGENWHDFVTLTVENGWFGLENLSLIPGLVGACPIQNIGAYGVEVKDSIFEVRYFDRIEKSFKKLSNSECKFGYRDSIFKHELKGKAIITQVTFKLKKKAPLKLQYGDLEKVLGEMPGELSPKKVSQAVIQIRKSKLPDPNEIGNAGSFFKNPEIEFELSEKIKKNYPELPTYSTQLINKVKVPAGWLIEKAGWKGYRKGDAGVHEKQALVLVNYGNATGKEILDLAHEIIDDIEGKFGIRLSPEVNVL